MIRTTRRSMPKDLQDRVTLSNGVAMPIIGYGSWPIPDREAEHLVADALDVGYQLIDTAEMYRNEKGWGGESEQVGSIAMRCSSRRS